MGVDYSSCAGYTIDLSEDLIEELMSDYNVDNEWDLFESIGLPYGEWGSRNYGGDGGLVLLCTPTPGKMDQEILEWLDEVNKKCKTSFKVKDVEWINETHVW